MATARNFSSDQDKSDPLWKHLRGQFSSFPCLGNLSFGNKKDLLYRQNKEKLPLFINQLTAERIKYQQFLKRKSRHPSYDIYACFQPFNEGFKAIFPFVAYLQAHLKRDDTILNLWDRSGWTASMLAGWFPEHHIITIWEGDKDILGYRGFDYWMSRERRKNHSVIFADFDRPLPLEDKSMDAIIGMDVLHRFNQPEFLSEVNRIAKNDAPVIFPHVHLTNNEPEPYFDRGCIQLHGNEYQRFFDNIEAETNRKGYILSEPNLFLWNETSGEAIKKLVSEPGHNDYNACVAWLPATSAAPLLKPWKAHEQDNYDEMYLLENPFFAVHPISREIGLREVEWGVPLNEFFARHPVYAERTRNIVGKIIQDHIVTVLYWAKHGLTIKEISEKSAITKETMKQILEVLTEADLAQVVPVDITGFRLQTLLGFQQYIPEKSENQLHALWKTAVAIHQDKNWCRSSADEVLTYSQADELIMLIQKALVADGIKKGDNIVLCTKIHAETLLLFWAAVTMGIVVVPVAAKQAAAKIKQHCALIRPKLLVTDPSLFDLFDRTDCSRIIMTDKPDDNNFKPESSFETWLSSALENDLQTLVIPEPNDIAVILWTSGTIGNPKGIPITHAQLLRSGRLITENYDWKSKDVYYCLGGLETMSGLRHATVAIAEVGASCVLPVENANIYDHINVITKQHISILAGNPSLYKQLLQVIKGNSIPVKLAVRLTLCTGNRLSKDLKREWQQLTSLPLFNYYGLTETSGICIAEIPLSPGNENGIGTPVDCLIKITGKDDARLHPGIPGELCIYGTGIFNGYHQNPEATSRAFKNGWFLTGDQAMQAPDGSIELLGRLVDIVKLPSGHRVEIEALDEVLQQIPDLKDWAIFPFHDQDKESIAAFLVLQKFSNIEKAIINVRAAIAQSIGTFALPSIIEGVAHIPRGNHNKVLRKELLESYFSTITNL